MRRQTLLWRWYTFCWVLTAPTFGSSTHLDSAQQPGHPERIGVDQTNELEPCLTDADAERGPLAGVMEEDRPDSVVTQGDDPVIGLHVGDVENDDDLVGVLAAPGLETLQKNVWILVVRGTTTEALVRKAFTMGRAR